MADHVAHAVLGAQLPEALGVEGWWCRNVDGHDETAYGFGITGDGGAGSLEQDRSSSPKAVRRASVAAFGAEEEGVLCPSKPENTSQI
jgi:hypothetical protein